MKKTILILLLSLMGFTQIRAQESTSERDKRMKWWREARFGMFIHWGPYAVWEGSYKGHEQRKGGAEWIMNRSKIPVAEYQQAAATFNPVRYDPESWVLLAKQAGMKYIVITAKHHDGFAMFRSNASRFNIADFTPYKKDVLEALAKACQKYHMKLGFYYSQAQDWNNPGGAASRKLTNEGWADPDSARIDAFTAANNGHWDPAQLTATMDEYIDKVAVPQVRELLTNYGKVAVLWWDTPTGMTDAYALKLQALLKLQPGIITNDRLKHPNFPGDTGTPEQKIPKPGELEGKDWETCMTMNGTWGYRASDNKWKSTEVLIRNLCDIASKGGNYLLNVGPNALGEIPQPSIQRLQEMGAWMKTNGEAIYATKGSPFGSFSWGRCTRKVVKGKTILYFAVFDWPKEGKLNLPGLTQKPLSATILTDGTKLDWTHAADGLVLRLPEEAPDAIATVIKVVIKGNLTQTHSNAQ
ncbi:MAG: alpha-L-fucosidase [Marinilabiliales bacterium]|nr:alpha-L-fucosidase [Marinilabiliales bacterium]